MKKKKAFWFFAALLFIILCFLFVIRDCTFPNNGGPGSSDNISESKILGVFLFKYVPEKSETIIKNNKLCFHEIWLEKLWVYSNNYRFPKTYSTDEIQCKLLITTQSHSFKEHLKSWWLELFYSIYPGVETGGTIIYRNMRWDEIKDTLEFRIIKRNDTSGVFDQDSIGVIRFIRLK